MERAESLAEYVRRVRQEKRLSLNDVVRQSGSEIANSHVSRIENGFSTNVTPEKLRALARGLQVSEDEIFAVAQGKAFDEPETPIEFGVLFHGWDEASDEDKTATKEAIKMIAESFQQRRIFGKAHIQGSTTITAKGTVKTAEALEAGSQQEGHTRKSLGERAEVEKPEGEEVIVTDTPDKRRKGSKDADVTSPKRRSNGK
jgi:transcriptional regulator with XRE-family HTH domain